tara:strand:+ start:31 stop:396 length:366 start_codon:yes stop_codon:yes gene_type:complete
MNLYEHTIVARQDVSQSQIKQLIEKYSQIVKKNKGKIIKTENWGLLNLSYLIKKNRKGNYVHFKIEGDSKIINELEKNEKIDVNLLRYLTIRVKKFDLETNYFGNNESNKDSYLKKDNNNE